MELKHRMETRQTSDPAADAALAKHKTPSGVRGMFTSIAQTYDLLNHLFSMNIDKAWRRKTARATVSPATSKILDVCGGTGDLALALLKQAQSLSARPTVICGDFTPAMMSLALTKFRRRESAVIPLVADTLALPFPDDAFDVVTVGFGIRNVANTRAGLKEMARVCRSGGKVAILEFSKTRHPLINWGFKLYFVRILPFFGRLVTGTKAYSYLSQTVEEFPEGVEFCALVSAATGSPCSATPLTFGIATLYVSTKA